VSGGTTDDGVNAIATLTSDERTLAVLIYNHVNGGAADGASSSSVTLQIDNLPFPADGARLRHYLVDRGHSNSYQAWVGQGRPAQPS
jgi:hypothetical protein